MTQFISLPYYRPALLLMNRLFGDEIRRGYVNATTELRKKLVLETFGIGRLQGSESTWRAGMAILDALDEELRKTISTRSSTYWLHLYRRTGVALGDDLDGDTGPTTTGLVRAIAEHAMQKHGLVSQTREFGFSNKLSAELVLGGWMKRGLKAQGSTSGSGERAYRLYSKSLKENPTWVIRDFGKKDLLNLYRIEGLSYQYWSITSFLRIMGKGADAEILGNGDWTYALGHQLKSLLASVDKRNEGTSSLPSMLGVWIDRETLFRAEKNSVEKVQSIVFFPLYNVRYLEVTQFLNGLGIKGLKQAATNFLPLYISIDVFLKNHRFMAETFESKKGFDFHHLIMTLAALSSFTILPSRALNAQSAQEADLIQKQAIMQSLQRGYHLFVGSSKDLFDIVIGRMKIMFKDDFDASVVERVLSAITLQEKHKSQISPWSGGPSFIILPTDGAQMLDLVSIPSYLSKMFFSMRDPLGTSGLVFEEQFREALLRRGYVVKTGKLYAEGGVERELDAGVVVKRVLYLFECVSIERPLDYEVGKPSTISIRNERLDAKLGQVETLRTFLEGNPVGDNYDFSEVERIEHFVVSPFVEWVWAKDDRLWFTNTLPRILSPEEAFSLLEK